MKEKIIKVTDFISNGCFFLTCVAKYVILSFAFYYVVTYYDIRYIMLGTYTMQMSKKIKSYSKERYVPRYYSTRKKKIIMNHSFKNENSRVVLTSTQWSHVNLFLGNFEFWPLTTYQLMIVNILSSLCYIYSIRHCYQYDNVF